VPRRAPGLAPLSLADRARERLVERSPSWYLDLRMIGRYTGPATGRRVYHHTAPVSMIRRCTPGWRVLDEGLDAAIARHEECGRLLQDGLASAGLRLFAAEGHRLPELTTVWVPDGVDDAKVRATLLDRYGIEIGGGLASSRAGCGASAAWATRPVPATCACCSGAPGARSSASP
jgi:alanine-glyoxylate transaminase/serine-glyoxylate transaminase/serine-pyruvate transaminase